MADENDMIWYDTSSVTLYINYNNNYTTQTLIIYNKCK